MATISITYTDNNDGTVSATTAAGGGTAGEKITTKSLTEVRNVTKGWVDQSIPGLLR